MENSPPSIVLWAAWPDVAGLVPQGTWRNFRCRPKKSLHFRCSSLIFCCDRTMYAWIWAVLYQLCLEIWSLTRASLQKLCTNNRGACYLCCIVEYSSFLSSFDSNCALLHRFGIATHFDYWHSSQISRHISNQSEKSKNQLRFFTCAFTPLTTAASIDCDFWLVHYIPLSFLIF